MVRRGLLALCILWALLPGPARAEPDQPAAEAAARAPTIDLDRETQARILALAPEHITDIDVKQTLALAPAPRIINLQGSVAVVTMAPFAEFLAAMGYPEQRLRNPRDGALSYSSFADSRELAGTLAWYYEHEGMMPMLIGHSQGGMMAVRVLHELAGDFSAQIPVWDPLRGEAEPRTSIVDPFSGVERSVIGLKVPYAAALATGTLPRILLGQWDMVKRLHEIPDTVEEFTAFSLEWDLIAGNFGSYEAYRATGSAAVRNVTLPASASHIGLPLAKPLALDQKTRAWIDAYDPAQAPAPIPEEPGVDMSNIVHAADIWHSVKKHWCLEAQRLIRSRGLAAANP
jgi:hypothetical protein